jgi:hypothetical protein
MVDSQESVSLPQAAASHSSRRTFASTSYCKTASPAFIPSVVSEAPGTPHSLLDQWIGHSNGNVTDRYIKSAEDREFRRKQVERIGTGLNLADTLVSQITSSRTHHDKATEKPGTRQDPSAEIVVKRSLVRRNPVLSAPDVVEAPTSPRYVASDEDLPETFSPPAMGPDEV